MILLTLTVSPKLDNNNIHYYGEVSAELSVEP